MINNVKLNLRITENVIPETEKISIINRIQNKFSKLAHEINQQNGTVTVDIYNKTNYRYDIEGVDIMLRYKFLNDFIHDEPVHGTESLLTRFA
jgi:hypothetical protein